MTAPPVFGGGSVNANSFAPRQFAGRRRSGASDGAHADVNAAGQTGALHQPAQPAVQTSHPPAAQASASAGATRPTFAQMQAAGQARPAPQQIQQAPAPSPVQGQLAGAVSQALATPSRYGLPQVEQVRNALTSGLQQQFTGQQRQLDEDMARRGLLSSSIASGYNGDLAGQQANALANMNAQLIQDQAATSAQDLSAALGAGLGLGNLGVAQQNAATQAQSVANQYALGQGGLGVQQGQLSLAQAAQSQNYGLAQAAQRLNEQVQTGQLSIAQANQQLAELQNAQQYGMQQQNFGLQSQLGLGNLALGQQQVANQASQFGQTFGLQQQAQADQEQQFQQQLAQALGLATMSDKTANRGIDAQAALANNDLMLRVAALLGLPTGGSTTAAGAKGIQYVDTGKGIPVNPYAQ